MPFRIMLVGSAKNDPIFASGPDGIWLEYDTGAEAQAAAKTLAAQDDSRKWRVKRVLDTKWKTREAEKFKSGVYLPLPWHTQSWWREINGSNQACRYHYAHVSRSVPGMIAYTESEEKGMDNKQTQIKPGKYLEKYFGKELKYFGISIKSLVNQFEAAHKPREVFFAKTADEIQNVYERGPASCMSNYQYRKNNGWGWPSPGEWPHNIHACRVYAEGDLQVAYITHSGKPTGRIEARALVWPERKTHSRCYGAEHILRQQLALLGYKAGAPIGAKLTRHPVKAHDQDLFLCPYIDVGQQSGAGATAVKDCKTHLEIVEAAPGTYPANATSGLCGSKLDRNMRPRQHNIDNCQNCGDGTEECGELYQVYTSNSGGDFRYWCVECLEETGPNRMGEATGAYQCAASGYWYSRRACPPVEMYDGYQWSPQQFRMHGFKCDATGKNFPSDHLVRMYNSKKWSISYFRANGFTCWYSGDHYPNEMKLQLASGKVMAATMFRVHGATCEGCSRTFLKRDMFKALCPRCTDNEITGERRLGKFIATGTEEYI